MSRSLSTTISPASPGEDRGLVGAIGLIGLVLVARLIYLHLFCPYNLVEDEAQYWLWSKHLDWSYYSKGPGVAWAIAVATNLLGDAEWAVRLPAAFASAVGATAVAALGRDVSLLARERATPEARAKMATPATTAVYAAGAFMLAPALQMVGVLITIDGPYVACWAVAAWAGWRAMAMRMSWAWLVLGLAIALGFLFKYTMLLLVPGVAVFACMRVGRMLGRAPRGWLIAGVAAALLGLAPVIVWNAQNDWSTVRHLLGHLGVAGGDTTRQATETPREWSPWWLPELIAQQVGLFGPVLVLACVAGARMIRARRGAGSDASRVDPRWAGQTYLMLCAAPIFAFYAVVALIAEPEGNWPMGGHVTLMVLAGWWAADAAAARRFAREHGLAIPRTARGLWHATIIYGVAAMPILHRADLAADAMNWMNTQSSFRAAFTRLTGREPKRVAIGRLVGAKEMAIDLRQRLGELRTTTGAEPFVIAQHYGRASQMTYELRNLRQPPLVLCAMEQTGGRKSQFDLWAWARLDNPALAGRPAIVLANDQPNVTAYFQSRFIKLEKASGGGRLAGEHKIDRFAYIGLGYRPATLPPAPAQMKTP